MAKRTVEIGQRYHDVRPGIYGRSTAPDWIVGAVQTDALGIRHARLVSAADPTEQKTLAADVLADPSRFEAVNHQDDVAVSPLNSLSELIGRAWAIAASLRSRLPRLR
jgi:hypothetical protein